MTAHRRVCLVTDELYPITAGGIGRLTHNLLRNAIDRDDPVELHVLFPGYMKFQPAEFDALFGGRVTLHVAPIRKVGERAADELGIYPTVSSTRDAKWHFESLDIMRKLAELEAAGLTFDVIEFPDFRGLAFCTLMEKRLGARFQGTEIAVRLHTTHGVLMHVEATAPELANLERFELERKALLDADSVIAHLPQIAEYNQAYYGFPEAWLEKVRLEFPPVVEGRSEGTLPSSTGALRDLAFVTKLQHCKDPEAFVRAAALLMERRPDYRGRAIVACHAFDAEYARKVKAIVPRALAKRFLFTPPGDGRTDLMRRSIVVIPSRYESLNLTAYEAASAGAVLVLNGRCPSFADRSPFLDGVNCFKSDGTVAGLSAAMERALDEQLPEPVRWTVQQPFWTLPPDRDSAADARPARTGPPAVSVVVVHRDRPWGLGLTLESLAAARNVALEVVIVDDASEKPVAMDVLAEVERTAVHVGQALTVLRTPIRMGQAASRNRGAAHCRSPAVCFLDAGDVVSPGFLELAARALEDSPTYDVVAPTMGEYASEAQLLRRRFSNYSLFLGDAPSSGLVQNQLAGRVFVVRRELVALHAFDETLERVGHWAAMLDWVHQGRRFLVTNHVHAFQQQDREREISSIFEARGRMREMTALWERVPQGGRTWRLIAPITGALAGGTGSGGAFRELGEDDLVPVRYETVEFLVRGLANVASFVPAPLRTRVGIKGSDDEMDGGVDDVVPAWANEQRPALYDVVDSLNLAMKALPGVHGGLKSATRRMLRRAVRMRMRLP